RPVGRLRFHSAVGHAVEQRDLHGGLLEHRWHDLDGRSYGTIPAMKATIDAAGRIVIPREIRRAAGRRPGVPGEVPWTDGRIEHAAAPVRLVRKGRFLVAVAPPEMEVLTADTVEATRQALQQERGLLE